MATKNCNKIKYSCSGDAVFATCTSYESDLPEFSEISGCPNIEETTTELYELVGELRDQTDLSELGEKCISYTKVEGKIFVKNVLLKMEEEICTLRERADELENTDICDKDITSCNFDFGTLVDSCGEKPQTLGATIQLILDTLNTA